jgi:septal ring factor EnvC (AmiA/AmiB activator)
MKKLLVAAVLFPLVVLQAPDSASQDDLKDTVEEAVDIGQSTQRKQDDWSQEQAELTQRYRTAKANVEYFSDRISIEQDKLTALEDRIDELERRLDESTRLRNSLQDTLDAAVAELEAWLSRDIPFLSEERKARLQALKAELARPDVTGAEKLRRVLEALQVETQYGGSVEVNQQKIVVESDTLFVDVLRVGRVSVFWRTPDGERVGHYDQGLKEWVALPGRYHRDIQAGMDMATRIRPVELISLPLGRIQP